MLAAADGGNTQHLALKLFYRAILRSNDEPKERATQGHHDDPQGRAPLDRANGAADGSLAVKLASNVSSDRDVGAHLNELRLQAFFTKIALLLSKEQISVVDSGARKSDANSLGRYLRGCLAD